MSYRVTLDGNVLATLPDGLSGFKKSIVYDEVFHARFVIADSELEFTNDGYGYLKAAWDESPCGELTCLIEYACNNTTVYDTLFDGVIFVNDVEFDLTNCTARTTVKDNTFQARLRNNRKIKAHVDSDMSKNEQTITPVTAINVGYFRPSDSSYAYTRKSWYVNDLFEYLVAFIGDGAVDYISPIFDAGGDWEYLVVSTGENLATNGINVAPYLSFIELYEEVNKRIPLSITIEDNAGTPRIRIEDRAYIFDSSVTAYTCRDIGGVNGNITGLKGRTDAARFYDKVVVGSATTLTYADNPTLTYPDAFFTNWKEEEFHVLGQCNSDNEFNLVGDWVVDSNVIEDTIVTPSNDYDDEFFLIECEDDGAGGVQAIAYDDLGGTIGFYNKLLTNQYIIQRYSEQMPGSIAQFIGVSTSSDLFKALPAVDDDNGGVGYTVTPAPTTINADPYPFDSEAYDYSANYDAVTNFNYTAPADGFYRFDVYVHWFDIGWELATAELNVRIKVRRYDSSPALLQTITDEEQVTLGYPEWHQYSTANALYLSATDTVSVEIEAETVTDNVVVSIKDDSYFMCSFAYTGGGTVAERDPADYRAKIYEFDFPVAFSELETMIDNRVGVVIVNPQSDTDEDIHGYIDRVDVGISDGIGNFVIISNE